MDNPTVMVARAGEIHRIVVVSPFKGARYFLTQKYDATYRDWAITGQVSIPSNYTEQDIEDATLDAVSTYMQEVS